MKHHNALASIPRSTLGVILALAILVVLLGWNYFAQPFASLNQVATDVVSEVVTPSPGNPPEAPVNFSPEEAVAQVLAYPVVVASNAPPMATPSTQTSGPSTLQPDDVAWIAHYRPAVVTLFGSRISNQAALLATGQIRAAYGDKPAIIAVDHEGGTTQRLSGTGFTVLPSWQSLCAQTGEAAATSSLVLGDSLSEVKQVGVDMVLAPVVDVGNSPVLGSRICSDEPGVVVDNATRFINAAEARDLVPVIKHFPGIGNITRDLHNTFDQVTVFPNEAQVYPQLLNRFPSLAVMVTHVGVTNQDPTVPCTFSTDCVRELKNNYPDSLIIADALEMESASYIASSSGTPATTSATLSQRAIAAINSGNELLLFGQSVTPTQMTTVYQDMLREYLTNEAFKAQLDLAATRVLKLQQRVTAR